MKITKISALGYLSGGFLIVSSFIRYWVLYSDLSQGIGFIISGFIIVFLAWLYGMVKEEINAREENIAEIKKELKKIAIQIVALEEWVQDKWTESSTKASKSRNK